MKKTLVILGGDTASEILTVAQQYYADQFDRIQKHYIDDDSEKALSLLKATSDKVFYCMGIVDSKVTTEAILVAKKLGMIPFTIIHPSAYIADSATIGDGSFIAPQAVISIHAEIGDHSIVHFHCSIGHHAKLGNEVKILPGARISGGVTIEDGVLIGSNAFVLQNVKIGSRSKIDALTYVRQDLECDTLVSGRLSTPVRLPTNSDGQT